MAFVKSEFSSCRRGRKDKANIVDRMRYGGLALKALVEGPPIAITKRSSLSQEGASKEGRAIYKAGRRRHSQIDGRIERKGSYVLHTYGLHSEIV